MEGIISTTAALAGTVFLISGIRYKERLKRRVLQGEERAAYARSNYFITTMSGGVILFAGLGGGYLATIMEAKSVVPWFLIIAFVGGLLIVVGRFLKKDTYET